MPRWRKAVCGPGIHTTPDGVAEVSPARIRHWHETIQGMLASGYKPPVSYGHVSGALPAGADDHAFWSARFNAGSVTGSEVDSDGNLVLTGDTPGVELDASGRLVSDATLPDGTKVKAAIEEVSIGARDWTDGAGRLWPDAPVHLALTPLPVWVPPGGQPAFEPAAAPTYFSSLTWAGPTRTHLGTNPMADEPDEKKKKKPFPDDEPADETPAEDAPAGPAEDPKPFEAGEPPAEPGTPAAGAKEGAQIADVLADLAAIGVALPADTTDANFKERLCVALVALKAQKGKEAAPTPEQPVTESPETFMSTLKDRDPVTRALVARVEREDRAKRLARIDALAARGLAPHQVKKLKEKTSAVRFSLAANGEPASAQVDETIEALEASLPPAGAFDRTYLSSMAGVAEAEPPEEEREGPKKHQRVADELARNTGLKKRGA